MTAQIRQESLRYYANAGPVTDIEKYREFVDWLTADVRAIFQVVQGILVHDGWLKAYGIEFNDAQRYDFNSLTMETVLDKAVELGGKSLSIPRAPDKRVIGCCREFATLMTALLRAKGTPARSRCGFAAYFDDSPTWVDHWVCEYWSTEQSRWILVDPQMDPFQQSVLSLSFSPLDIPRSQFLTGAEAWLACLEERFDPEHFGISGNSAEYNLETLFGLWFVRGNLLRDFASLNKVETVPLLMRLWRGLSWDSWRLARMSDEKLTANDQSLLDQMARFATSPDVHFNELRALYQSNKELQPGDKILRYE
jgi:hypothetical protein